MLTPRFGDEEIQGRRGLGEEMKKSVASVLHWVFLLPPVCFPLSCVWPDSSRFSDLTQVPLPQTYLP